MRTYTTHHIDDPCPITVSRLKDRDTILLKLGEDAQFFVPLESATVIAERLEAAASAMRALVDLVAPEDAT